MATGSLLALAQVPHLSHLPTCVPRGRPALRWCACARACAGAGVVGGVGWAVARARQTCKCGGVVRSAAGTLRRGTAGPDGYVPGRPHTRGAEGRTAEVFGGQLHHAEQHAAASAPVAEAGVQGCKQGYAAATAAAAAATACTERTECPPPTHTHIPCQACTHPARPTRTHTTWAAHASGFRQWLRVCPLCAGHLAHSRCRQRRIPHQKLPGRCASAHHVCTFAAMAGGRVDP